MGDLGQLEKLFTEAHRRNSFPEMLNSDFILKIFLGSLVPWSEGSYYFICVFFPKIQDNLNTRSL